jgi:hypothetical protein
MINAHFKETLMVKCRITLVSLGGDTVSYEGVFPSTVEATMDALEKFGFCKVKVEVI